MATGTVDVVGAESTGMELAGTELDGIELTGTELTGTEFTGKVSIGVVATGTELTGVVSVGRVLVDAESAGGPLTPVPDPLPPAAAGVVDVVPVSPGTFCGAVGFGVVGAPFMTVPGLTIAEPTRSSTVIEPTAVVSETTG